MGQFEDMMALAREKSKAENMLAKQKEQEIMREKAAREKARLLQEERQRAAEKAIKSSSSSSSVQLKKKDPHSSSSSIKKQPKNEVEPKKSFTSFAALMKEAKKVDSDSLRLVSSSSASTRNEQSKNHERRSSIGSDRKSSHHGDKGRSSASSFDKQHSRDAQRREDRFSSSSSSKIEKDRFYFSGSRSEKDGHKNPSSSHSYPLQKKEGEYKSKSYIDSTQKPDSSNYREKAMSGYNKSKPYSTHQNDDTYKSIKFDVERQKLKKYSTNYREARKPDTQSPKTAIKKPSLFIQKPRLTHQPSPAKPTYHSPPKRKISSITHTKKFPTKNSIPNDLIGLNQRQREIKSVDEIQDELRRKKNALGKTKAEEREEQDRRRKLAMMRKESPCFETEIKTPSKKNVEAPKEKNPSKKNVEIPIEKKPDQVNKTKSFDPFAKPSQKSKSTSSSIPVEKKKTSSRSEKKRSLSPSIGQPKKKKKPNLDQALSDPAYLSKNISSVIGQMFGYNRARYADEVDDTSDMEVGFGDVRREEARSSRMGKIEDSKEDERDVIRRREREKKRK